jgi:hypothetical protein
MFVGGFCPGSVSHGEGGKVIYMKLLALLVILCLGGVLCLPRPVDHAYKNTRREFNRFLEKKALYDYTKAIQAKKVKKIVKTKEVHRDK